MVSFSLSLSFDSTWGVFIIIEGNLVSTSSSEFRYYPNANFDIFKGYLSIAGKNFLISAASRSSGLLAGNRLLEENPMRMIRYTGGGL